MLRKAQVGTEQELEIEPRGWDAADVSSPGPWGFSCHPVLTAQSEKQGWVYVCVWVHAVQWLHTHSSEVLAALTIQETRSAST